MSPNPERAPDRVAKLLQESGPRPVASDRASRRARKIAHGVWSAEVRKRRTRLYTSAALIGLATAAVAVIAIRYSLNPVSGGPGVVAHVNAADGAPVHVGDVFVTKPGERTRLILSNNAEVRVDGDTELRFAAARALALQRGAVFVDTGTATSTERSVQVMTPAGVARDVGTRFEVRVTRQTTTIRVRDGMVELTSKNAVNTAGRGAELVVDQGGVSINAISTASPAWNWVAQAAAPLNLDGKTLPEFLEWVSREGGWTVRFADETLRRDTAAIVLHGSVAGMTPSQALDTILPTCGLTHRIDADVVLIDRAGAGR